PRPMRPPLPSAHASTRHHPQRTSLRRLTAKSHCRHWNALFGGLTTQAAPVPCNRVRDNRIHQPKTIMKPSAKPTFLRLKRNQIQLIASGDLRLSANQVCWPAQNEMEDALRAAIQAEGFEV